MSELLLKTPSPQTLKKYGLDEAEWRRMAEAQKSACFVCEQVPTKGRLCIDHFHVKGWKHMPPEQRRLWVRGLLCFRCNTSFVGRGVTIQRSEKVVEYLKAFEARRPPEVVKVPKKRIVK